MQRERVKSRETRVKSQKTNSTTDGWLGSTASVAPSNFATSWGLEDSTPATLPAKIPARWIHRGETLRYCSAPETRASGLMISTCPGSFAGGVGRGKACTKNTATRINAK